MLDFGHQQHRLSVKAADHPEVDLPAEATLHLNEFRNEKEVHEIVHSYDFVMQVLNRDQVRLMGSFLKLRELKSHLEQLHKSQNQTKTAPHSSTPSLRHPPASSGAVPKHYPNDHLVPDGRAHRNLHSSRRTRFSFKKSRSIHQDSPPGSNSFFFDSDVLQYAQRFRKKDVNVILTSHDVSLKVGQDNPGINSITLLGKKADQAAEKLKELLSHLSKSLRTQEIPLKDLDGARRAALAKRIQEEKQNSVLIFELPHKVRIIGTSSNSFEVKQRLLDPSNKTLKDPRSSAFGRFFVRGPAARAQVSAAAGAPDYSGSKQQNDQSVEPKRGAFSQWSLRKNSSKVKDQVKTADDIKPEKENKEPTKFKFFREILKVKK
ncbi:uncharacterized protein si:dkey-154b15.1 isoform X2 [Thalassophryne amazonica]|nr:uncharacterized protein si:dkey-154b15.1 isoform X2 [Thalassophryne amazonica]